MLQKCFNMIRKKIKPTAQKKRNGCAEKIFLRAGKKNRLRRKKNRLRRELNNSVLKLFISYLFLKNNCIGTPEKLKFSRSLFSRYRL